jgi:phytoene dehydrogenase-like protein
MVPSSTHEFDAIIIGSGMGGMTTATALSRMGQRVLLLEQAQTIGGLTHTFSRQGFTWDVGIHYCGTFRRDQPGGKMLQWLSDGAVEFHSVGTIYDTLHFPEGTRIPVGRPAEAFVMELKERFPDSAAGIDAYFEALQSGEESMHMVTAERSMPEPFRSAHRWWNNKTIQRWCGRTTGEVIADYIDDPKLAAILSAQWGTFGGAPNRASFGLHATIMRHYLDGAGYPVGGASAIAKGLVPVIESAGGSARAATPVTAILIEDEKAVGVRTSSGEEFKAPVIVSGIGAGETVERLLPPEIRKQEWAVEIAGLRPSVCHFEIFLGFEGDIEKHGATRSNHWFYESWNTDDGIWSDVDAPILMMFASFPSLKDDTHDPGPSNRHTGQCMVLADWSTVAGFADGGAKERPAEWATFKQNVETRLMDYYTEKFPALASLVTYRELGTPLATAAFTAHENAGFYGIETTPRRVLSDALSPRTPVPGLFLTGQDVLSPGIAGALWGGMLCAAAIDPRVYTKLG